MIEKHAKTKHPIHPLLARRWSPRAFADRAVEPDKLRQLFEAARWAASSFNEQPWSFIVATKDDRDAFNKAVSCLVEKNQLWAKHAPVLLLTTVKRHFTKGGKANRVAEHDLGLAMGNLTVQATELGLVLHQMAGVELDKVRQLYEVPTGHDPQTAAAIGYQGEAASLPEDWMRDAELAERERKDFDEFVFGGKFGRPSGLFD